MKDVAFNRFVHGLAGWALRQIFEKPTKNDLEARRVCLRAATYRKLSYMQYEAKDAFVKWAGHAVALYRKKLSWAEINSYLDTMYVYARWALSTCGPLLDAFVEMMAQLIRTTSALANDMFVKAADKEARLRALGQEVLRKWTQALWKAALKNADHRVPEHRSGSFRQSVLESKDRARRAQDYAQAEDELDLYYGDANEMLDSEDEEEM